jgi:hypothetical protein
MGNHLRCATIAGAGKGGSGYREYFARVTDQRSAEGDHERPAQALELHIVLAQGS